MVRMTQAAVRPAPQAPLAQAAPAANVVPSQILTPRDVAALRARGRELSNQISSASSRRDETRQALRNATGADKLGLEERLGVLDKRIASLEGDIAENGRQLASLDAMRAGTLNVPNNNVGRSGRERAIENAPAVLIVFTLFVLCPIAISIARGIWKRNSTPKQAPPNPETTQRLERMEQAIDSIAIEIERVSEGQRFVTRILAEGGRTPSAVGAGQQAAQPISVLQGERLGTPR